MPETATFRDGVSARNVRRIAHLDLPGIGQVYVKGNLCYLGHHPVSAIKSKICTTILDISDPSRPTILTQIENEDPDSHSHKVRVVGDTMIINVEQNSSRFGRKTEEYVAVQTRLTELLGRAPTNGEIAEKLGLPEADIPALIEVRSKKYQGGGFKIYDVSNPVKPKFLHYERTGEKGTHRFDMDDKYAYISTGMEGYRGNILVIYDITRPDRPQEVSRWWMPGQHLAGGEKPHWSGRKNRLHHALRFGDRLWAGVWNAGLRVIDIADITKPRTIGAYNYHPPFPATTHTVMPAGKLGGKEVMLAIDEEEAWYNPVEAARRKGQPHAALWVFDCAEIGDIKPLSVFTVSEIDSPFSQAQKARFGAHQFHEKMKDSLVYCAWFSAGLRIVDVADAMLPREVGWFIPEPIHGLPAPQSNDVFVDDRGLIHLADRNAGYDILEFAG